MPKLALPLLALLLTLGACAGGGASTLPTPHRQPPRGIWAAADARALSAPRALARDPAALVGYLTRGARNDTEKARSIFRWIAENISYDYDEIEHPGSISPQNVLRRGKSVCNGYSSLFEMLGTLAGLRVVTIYGWAKGYDWQPGARFGAPNHSWNAVFLDGRWRLVDSTWGAGYVRDRRFVKQLDDYFFLPPPEDLAFTHLAQDPRWQLIPHPLDLRRFEAQPTVRPSFFRAGFTAADARAALRSRSSAALVNVFLRPDQPLFFRLAPAQRVLTAGRTYRFEVRAPVGSSVAVINAGRWQYLRPMAGSAAGSDAAAGPAGAWHLLTGAVSPLAGDMYVAARTPDSGPAGYQTILLYEAK